METHREPRAWRSADEWLKSVEDTPDVPFRPLTRPVLPASDAECYALNPPMSMRPRTRQGAGQRRRTPAETERRLSRQQAEQAAREAAAYRVNMTSDAILRLGQDDQ